MIQLTAKLDEQQASAEISIEGLPGKSVAEIRVQNTSNGKECVHLIDIASDGTGRFQQKDFGTWSSVRMRVLDDENDEAVHSFVQLSQIADLLVLLDSDTYGSRVTRKTKPPQPQIEPTVQDV